MIVLVVVAILASVGAGVWAERRHGDAAQRGIQRAVRWFLWYVLPPIIVVVIARLEIKSGVGLGLLLGYLTIGLVGVVAWFVGARILKLPRSSTGAMIVTAILANTGYLGLPLVLVLLGGDELGYGIVWDSLISFPMAFVVAFAIGAAFGDHGADDLRSRTISFFAKTPVMWAIPIGLVWPEVLAPDWLYTTLKLVSASLLPLGFFMVGVQLSAEGEAGQFRFPPPLTKPVAVIVGLRLAAAPLILFALAALTGGVPEAYHLQSAMPCGINALIVAHVYELDLELSTSAIAWSTALFAVEVAVLAFVL